MRSCNTLGSRLRRFPPLHLAAATLLALCTISPAQTNSAADPNPEFVSLLDLKDSSLKGWTAENKDRVYYVNSKPFEPPDYVAVDPMAGWVRSERTFARFVLRFDIRLPARSTRALLVFRGCTSEEKHTTGYAIPLPIGDEFIHPAVENAQLKLLTFPKIVEFVQDKWITYELLVERDDRTGGDHIRIKLDGRLVGDTVQQRASAAAVTLFGPKADDGLGPGWIGFHVINGDLDLRNIYIAPK